MGIANMEELEHNEEEDIYMDYLTISVSFGIYYKDVVEPLNLPLSLSNNSFKYISSVNFCLRFLNLRLITIYNILWLLMFSSTGALQINTILTYLISWLSGR